MLMRWAIMRMIFLVVFSFSFSLFPFLDFSIFALVAIGDVLHDVLDVTVRVTPMRFSSQLNPSLGLSPSIRLSRSFAVNRSSRRFRITCHRFKSYSFDEQLPTRPDLPLFQVQSNKRKMDQSIYSLFAFPSTKFTLVVPIVAPIILQDLSRSDRKWDEPSCDDFSWFFSCDFFARTYAFVFPTCRLTVSW